MPRISLPGKTPGRGFTASLLDRTCARIAGFFAIIVLAAALARLFSGVPAETLAAAFLFALPSRWFSLRHRSDESVRTH